MKKQMIAVAVAAVFAAPMAMADAEVYGTAHVSVGQTDNNATDGSRIQMLPNNSNIGFRGSEDLGGGLKAEYQAETGYAWDAGTWGSARDSFVGLGGDWGAVRVGRANSPFKNATGSLDPFADTVFDYNNIMGQSGDDTDLSSGSTHDTRISNAIWYNSANLSGFAFQAMYGVNDRTGAGTKNEPDSMSIGGTYKAGPIFVGAAWQSLGEAGRDITDGDGVNADSEAWRIGGSYTFKEATMIGLAYENVDHGKGTADEKSQDRDAYFVSLSHKIGATTLALSYADADKVADAADTSATQIAVGVTQALSKATSAYAIYGQLSGDADAPAGYTIAGGTVTPSNDGSGDVEATGLMVGVVHKFSSK